MGGELAQDPHPRSGGGGPPKAVEGAEEEHARAGDHFQAGKGNALGHVVARSDFVGLPAEGAARRATIPATASDRPWILDFYCSKAKIAVEVDGAQHDMPDQILHNEQRDAWLSQRGIRVMRFAAPEILKDDELEGVLSAIVEAAAAPSTAFGGPPPPLRG